MMVVEKVGMYAFVKASYLDINVSWFKSLMRNRVVWRFTFISTITVYG